MQSILIPVFAHFMTWATVPGQWAIAGSMPLVRDNPAGGYASANVEIIAAQNALMESRGIVPLLSWWARDTYAGDKFLKLYLSVPGPQVGILYEAVGPGRMPTGPDGRVNIGDAANAEIFISDMRHLQERFFDRYPDRFFRIDGRPVVFVWYTHAFDGPFDQVVAQARRHASFFLIGSDFSVPFNARPGMEVVVRGMDAVSSYNFYDPAFYGIDIPEDFLADYEDSVRKLGEWLDANAPGVRLILPMQFAYDETRIPGRRGLHFRASPEVARRYAAMVRDLVADPCDPHVLPYAYATSFNEHIEGSALEPREVSAEEARLGFAPTTYLDAVSDAFSAVPAPSAEHRGCNGGEPGKDPAGGND